MASGAMFAMMTVSAVRSRARMPFPLCPSTMRLCRGRGGRTVEYDSWDRRRIVPKRAGCSFPFLKNSFPRPCSSVG